jgi:hypothetical protein
MVKQTLEFWPDYGAGPLWGSVGQAVDPLSLPLSPELGKRVVSRAAKYAEDKIPFDGAGDTAWIEEGRILLRLVRGALCETHDVIVTEPWWTIVEVISRRGDIGEYRGSARMQRKPVELGEPTGFLQLTVQPRYLSCEWKTSSFEELEVQETARRTIPKPRLQMRAAIILAQFMGRF